MYIENLGIACLLGSQLHFCQVLAGLSKSGCDDFIVRFTLTIKSEIDIFALNCAAFVFLFCHLTAIHGAIFEALWSEAARYWIS